MLVVFYSLLTRLVFLTYVWLGLTSVGIKEYSEWPTVPQLYVNREFIGGTDIMVSMHQDGSLAKLLEEKDVLVASET